VELLLRRGMGAVTSQPVEVSCAPRLAGEDVNGCELACAEVFISQHVRLGEGKLPHMLHTCRGHVGKRRPGSWRRHAVVTRALARKDSKES